MRRDVWHAFISEIISLYEFIREYGPDDDDPSTRYVYGAHKGKSRAIRSAANSIARLQCLQFIRKLSEDPAKLVQFSYLRNVPYGDVVLQTLAVNFWGGQLVTKFTRLEHEQSQLRHPSEDRQTFSIHVFDIDGSAYLRKWKKSPSWASNSSLIFWKNTSVRQGIVLSKNLVVVDLNLVERAALTCKEKSQIVERTQATIDAAMIKGIPSNIDLFKELLLPFVVVAKNLEKLRCWEDPHLTISFLAFAYTVIFRHLLPYVLPVTLIIMATAMLLLKGLREQGRLGRSFGKVTIRDQPPSNTIQKIIAVKEAMADLENYLQNLNVTLLKFRTILLSGQPEITTEVALVLLCSATVLLVVPFRYILAFVILDLFTRELEFRREMVTRFTRFVKDRWAAVYASPVVILPYESDELNPTGDTNLESDREKSRKKSSDKSGLNS
uniref:GRAM domain-containing protein 4 n=1 Tax=Anthurium amnicola TaxID=1678845 RepID=A0A1D1XEE2_9ARAE